jgi:hypothetical protein
MRSFFFLCRFGKGCRVTDGSDSSWLVLDFDETRLQADSWVSSRSLSRPSSSTRREHAKKNRIMNSKYANSHRLAASTFRSHF